MSGATYGANMGTQKARAARDAGYAVRIPEVTDAPEIGQIHVEVWRATYVGLMSADFLASLDPARSAARWTRRIVEQEPEQGYLVGTTPEGEIAGFAAWGPPVLQDSVSELELYSLNVTPRHQGSGLADLLMSESIAQEPCELWVADGGRQAINFFQRYGFRLDGAERRDEEIGGVVQLRMVRE